MAVFGFVAWEFLSVIYESRWDKLIANSDNKSFRQCVSSQFNKTPTKNITTKKLFKGKQANTSRVSCQSLRQWTLTFYFIFSFFISFPYFLF